jgi:hypothetical protein
MVHGQVCQYFTVQFNALLGAFPHEFAIRHAVLTRTCIDSLNPKGSELTLSLLSSGVSIEKSFLYCIFSDGPNILSGTVVPFGHLEDFFSARPRRD